MRGRNAEIDPARFPVPLLGFAAFSGTGKTTLLLQLLPLLKEAGLRVAVVKHAHHSFDVDRPGKDSYRMRSNGADEVLVAGRCRMAWIRECADETREPRLGEALAILDPANLDLVLVEGFKTEAFPKIELHRPALGLPLLFPRDPHVVAVASDGELAADPGDLPQLPLNEPRQVLSFVLDFIGHRGTRAAGLAC